jgi:xylulokinase
VLEGVSYGLCDSLQLMRALQIEPAQVRASGGGARSALWRQMLADIFDTEIAKINVAEGAAFGAALLAGVGAGVFADVAQAARATITVTERVTAGAASAAYARYYPRYQALYPALAAEFGALAALAREDAP